MTIGGTIVACTGATEDMYWLTCDGWGLRVYQCGFRRVINENSDVWLMWVQTWDWCDVGLEVGSHVCDVGLEVGSDVCDVGSDVCGVGLDVGSDVCDVGLEVWVTWI